MESVTNCGGLVIFELIPLSRPRHGQSLFQEQFAQLRVYDAALFEVLACSASRQTSFHPAWRLWLFCVGTAVLCDAI